MLNLLEGKSLLLFFFSWLFLSLPCGQLCPTTEVGVNLQLKRTIAAWTQTMSCQSVIDIPIRLQILLQMTRGNNRLAFTISANATSRALLAPAAPESKCWSINWHSRAACPDGASDQQAANFGHSRSCRQARNHPGCFVSFHVTGKTFLPNWTW